MGRPYSYRVPVCLAELLVRTDCPIRGFVGIAHAARPEVPDSAVSAILRMPDVHSVKAFCLGANLETVDVAGHGTMGSGYYSRSLDTLIVLNLINHSNQAARAALKRRLVSMAKDDSNVYIFRVNRIGKSTSRLKYFTDEEFAAELKPYFMDVKEVPIGNGGYRLVRCRIISEKQEGAQDD
jgi:hypothetical protein